MTEPSETGGGGGIGLAYARTGVAKAWRGTELEVELAEGGVGGLANPPALVGPEPCGVTAGVVGATIVVTK